MTTKASAMGGEKAGLCAAVLLLSACHTFGPMPEPPAATATSAGYLRTNPPEPSGYARRNISSDPAYLPQIKGGAVSPQALDARAGSPQRPAVYAPPGAAAPRLQFIGDNGRPIPAWVQQPDTTLPRQPVTQPPRSYTAPDQRASFAPPQRAPAEYRRPLPALRSSPDSRARDVVQEPSAQPSFIDKDGWFPSPRVTQDRPRYEIQNERVSDKDRALSSLGTPAPALRRPQPSQSPIQTQAYMPSAARVSAYTPPPAYNTPARNDNRLATPVASVPSVPGISGVVLGAGDVITIKVLGRDELSATVDVNGDGRINVPLAGEIAVSGLDTSQAAGRIAQALREGEFVINPQVTVVASDSRSQQISVLGEVKSPGRFKVETRTTVLDGLAQAGGISETGANFAYILRREGPVVVRYEMDLDALLEAGAGQQYFELQTGDTVVVPKAELFYIYGEVRAPNVYRIKPGMLVIQALSMASGLTDKGSEKRIIVRRRDERGELREFAASLDDAIQRDDVIYVKERFF